MHIRRYAADVRPTGQQGVSEIKDRLGRQGAEAHVHRARPPQIGERQPQGVVWIDLIAPVCHQQQDAAPEEMRGKDAEQVHAAGVGPLDVLQAEQQRALGVQLP